MKRYQELFTISSKINPRDPDAPEIYLFTARAMLDLGAVAKARMALERSLDLKLEQPEALGLLSALYLASGDSSRGLALLKLMTDLEPASYRPWLAMGKVYQDMGELSDAANAYTEALKRTLPDDDAKLARIGQLRSMIDDNRASEALPIALKSLETQSGDPDFLGLAALCSYAEGAHAEALKYAETALSLNPDSADAMLVKARVLFLEDNASDAETLLLAANRAHPNQLPILQLLMQTQARQGKTEQANATKAEFQELSERTRNIDKLTKEIDRKPDDPVPRYELGKLAVEAHMNKLAEQCFKAAIDLDPNYQAAIDALEQLNTTNP